MEPVVYAGTGSGRGWQKGTKEVVLYMGRMVLEVHRACKQGGTHLHVLGWILSTDPNPVSLANQTKSWVQIRVDLLGWLACNTA